VKKSYGTVRAIRRWAESKRFGREWFGWTQWTGGRVNGRVKGRVEGRGWRSWWRSNAPELRALRASECGAMRRIDLGVKERRCSQFPRCQETSWRSTTLGEKARRGVPRLDQTTTAHGSIVDEPRSPTHHRPNRSHRTRQARVEPCRRPMSPSIGDDQHHAIAE
jgi:hypothetical protein